MVIRALVSFIALPGIFALIAPPLIAHYDPWHTAHWIPGIFVMIAGAFILLWCVRDFFVSGKGTLAPWDPPKRLVVIGLYRFVRNPMYLGVLLLVLGWSLYFCSLLLLLYATFLALGFHIRVVKYEEPWLKERYAGRWDLYEHEVSRWLPRRSPWKEGS